MTRRRVRVPIDPRNLSRTDRVIAWLLGMRFDKKGGK